MYSLDPDSQRGMKSQNLPTRNPSRGAGLLLEHFQVLDQMSVRGQREPARVRLQRALGPDLSQLLLRALVRDESPKQRAVTGDPAA